MDFAANSFMQCPVGYAIQNGRAEMMDIVALLTNGQLRWNGDGDDNGFRTWLPQAR